jgi:diguanylate cyclase (GGDEF)-like protein
MGFIGSCRLLAGYLGTVARFFSGRPRLYNLIGAGIGAALIVSLLSLARSWDFSAQPLLYLYLEIAGSLISFCYAANSLIRFRSTHDRLSLMLGFGFIVSGTIESLACFRVYNLLGRFPEAFLHIPMGWMVGRTLLGVLLITAVLVERRIPNAREPGREIFAALVIVAGAAYLTSAAFLAAPAAPLIHPGSLISRPWDLFPAVIFGIAALLFWRRLRMTVSGLDYVFFWASILNSACHVAASFSGRLLDAPFTLANILKVSSYALMLGGALVDNARLFDQVKRLAISDSLTGLANYRRMLSVIESEIDRSRRTGRPFVVMLFDMDGLKLINDRFGHLVGSRALVRLGHVLRQHCRAMDTAARYGGDEFSLVLPEAGPEIAGRIVRRICERLSADGELPVLSVSAGAAVYPRDGDTTEKLLGAADRALYRTKNRGRGVGDFRRIAACL